MERQPTQRTGKASGTRRETRRFIDEQHYRPGATLNGGAYSSASVPLQGVFSQISDANIRKFRKFRKFSHIAGIFF
jgi:hypothetical protein